MLPVSTETLIALPQQREPVLKNADGREGREGRPLKGPAQALKRVGFHGCFSARLKSSPSRSGTGTGSQRAARVTIVIRME